MQHTFALSYATIWSLDLEGKAKQKRVYKKKWPKFDTNLPLTQRAPKTPKIRPLYNKKKTPKEISGPAQSVSLL